jgi:hypothetical protein
MKKQLTNLLILSLSITILSSCMNNTVVDNSTKETTWVYVESSKIIKKDTTNYYLYGQMKSSLLEKINSKEDTDGIFQITKVRFINDDDLIEIYEDNDQLGSLYFRIQNINYLSIYKRDPIFSFEDKDLHETAKKVKLKSKDSIHD